MGFGKINTRSVEMILKIAGECVYFSTVIH